MKLNEWRERERPSRLEKRYEFDDYEELRAFLDDAAALSEANDLYPDIGFSRTSASFTIHADEDSLELTDQQRQFATLLDKLESARRI